MTPEARILELAEQATPGPWASDDKGVFTADGAGPIAWVGDAYPRGDNHPTENMAYIAALSPSTVKAMCRVVEAAREKCWCIRTTHFDPQQHESSCHVRAALDALDAEGESRE